MLTRFLHLLHIVRRPLTLGVRGAVFDERGRVFLVRHTYVEGWYLPGGGVDAGEDVFRALVRELAEEGGLKVDAAELFGVYHNANASRRDHVVLFVCRDAVQTSRPEPNLEIAESGFFDADDLPSDTTPATHRRLKEIAGKAERSAVW
jgi:ADP-ribose pyrophosphatase YjhB (NUDIX family)